MIIKCNTRFLSKLVIMYRIIVENDFCRCYYSTPSRFPTVIKHRQSLYDIYFNISISDINVFLLLATLRVLSFLALFFDLSFFGQKLVENGWFLA